MIKSTPMLSWRADGALTRLVAEIDGDDSYLVIDNDDDRKGECKWFLTWFDADQYPQGLILQSDVDPGGLKAYARSWVGDDDE